MASPRKPPETRLLGKRSEIAESPDKAVLDRVPNPHANTRYVARFTAPEFTCLCPITGQPDFAHLVIDYVPDRWLVESKSLKFYLASFRNHGAFHEDCTVAIGKRIAALLEPHLRIGGYCTRAAAADRRVLADGTCPKGVAPRPGRRALPRAGLRASQRASYRCPGLDRPGVNRFRPTRLAVIDARIPRFCIAWRAPWASRGSGADPPQPMWRWPGDRWSLHGPPPAQGLRTARRRPRRSPCRRPVPETAASPD
jgi:7-cyano-7-deazaguanine reductase